MLTSDDRLSAETRNNLINNFLIVEPGPSDPFRHSFEALEMEMGRTYDSNKFPRLEEDPQVFEGLAISWKSPEDGVEGDAG